MTLHVKDAGTWKSVTPYVKDGGTWKEITNAYVKDGGSWKEFFAAGGSPPSYTYTLTLDAQTGSGTSVQRAATLSPESGTPYWSTSYYQLVSSDPPGFASGRSILNGTPNDDYHKSISSTSYSASSGTTVTLTYKIWVANIVGTPLSDPDATFAFVHQF